MPWSIDGPSSEQLGYLRRREGGEAAADQQPARRYWVGIALVAVIVVLLAVLAVLYLTDRPPQIVTAAPGTWREVGTPERYSLVLRETANDYFKVDYPRVGGLRAMLRGDSIVIMRSWDDPAARCVLTYDAGSDRLTAKSDQGMFALERVP
jgi:hypothetical protein